MNLANTIDHNERSTAKKKSVSKTKLIHNKVPLAAKEPKEYSGCKNIRIESGENPNPVSYYDNSAEVGPQEIDQEIFK